MNKDAILGLIRHVLTFAGGITTSQGITTDQDTTASVGAMITLISVTWSIVSKRRAGAAPTSLFILPSALCLLPFLAGCMSVPATRIAVDPTSHELRLQSPKDVSIGALNAVISTNGQVTIELVDYKAENNVDVIRTIADANAKMQEDIAARSQALITELSKQAP